MPTPLCAHHKTEKVNGCQVGPDPPCAGRAVDIPWSSAPWVVSNACRKRHTWPAHRRQMRTQLWLGSWSERNMMKEATWLDERQTTCVQEHKATAILGQQVLTVVAEMGSTPPRLVKTLNKGEWGPQSTRALHRYHLNHTRIFKKSWDKKNGPIRFKWVWLEEEFE